ncbi:hypothetical protein [uncultured Fibrella sp.]|uniref:hypothetical protein n=1 Tax=uncultured Fibrella sp. TaxID=1284596 RepID=UPI0035CC3458
MSDQDSTSHLGKLVPTEEALAYIGDPAEATFNNWKRHFIYVAHGRSGDDGKSNMYYVNCLRVRHAIFLDLKTRQFPRKFIQSTIGTLFIDEFGAADEHLMKALQTRKAEDIIQAATAKFIRLPVDKI